MEMIEAGTISTRSMNQCSPPPPEAAAASDGGGFDCNICLDFAVDPVVTFCGHLYCWPCIYKWLTVPGAGDDADDQSCPVCKTALSEDRLVPLYGRGGDTAAPAESLEIPRRPRGHPATIAAPSPPLLRRHRHQYSSGDDAYLRPLETSAFDSMAGGVLKEIAGSMMPWFFSDRLEAAMALRHHHPRTQLLVPASSERARLRKVKAHCVLNQLLSFLSIFAILCFLIF